MVPSLISWEGSSILHRVSVVIGFYPVKIHSDFPKYTDTRCSEFKHA